MANPSRSLLSIMLVVNGIHLLENMKLEDLAAKRAWEFAFVMQPLKMQGISGSTVAPVAIADPKPAGHPACLRPALGAGRLDKQP